MDASLHADLGGAAVPGFLGAVGDLRQGERVRLLVDLALCERAEAAPHVAHVREVDVPVDHVRDVVTHRLGTKVVGDPAQRVERVPLGAEQGERFLIGERAMG